MGLIRMKINIRHFRRKDEEACTQVQAYGKQEQACDKPVLVCDRQVQVYGKQVQVYDKLEVQVCRQGYKILE